MMCITSRRASLKSTILLAGNLNASVYFTFIAASDSLVKCSSKKYRVINAFYLVGCLNWIFDSILFNVYFRPHVKFL